MTKISLISLVVLFTVGAAQATNLLTNGDFEAGTTPIDANWGNAATAANLPSWSYYAGTNVALNAGDGTLGFGNGSNNIVYATQDVQVGLNALDAGVYQTITTEVGKTYDVSFDYGVIWFDTYSESVEITAVSYDGAGVTGTLIDSLAVSYSPGGSGVTVGNMTDNATFTFTAASTQTTIELKTTAFRAGMSGSIDNVSVTTDDTCIATIPEDLNQDCIVDLADFSMLASAWLACTRPLEPGCIDLQ